MSDAIIVWVISQEEWELAKLSKESQGAPVLGLFSDGAQRWVRAQNIQFRSYCAWSGTNDHKQLRQHGQRVVAFLDEAKRQLGDLWTMLYDDTKTRSGVFDLYELGSFLSDPSEPAFQDAVARALCEDQSFFKRKGDKWSLRAKASVEENLKRRSKQDQRAERERPWVDAILQAMRGEDLDIHGSSLLKEACLLLESVVLHPPESAHHVRGRSLLRRLPGATQNASSDHALEILIEIGFYDQDENLDLRRHKITTAFSEPLIEEGRRISALEPTSQASSVLDFNSYAIDSEVTQDIDDAIAVRRVNNGFEVHILISNLARILPLENPIAQEAAKRGSTLYLPRGQAPMLPRLLSEDSLSLREGVPRHVIDFCVLVNSEGVPYDTRIEFAQTDRVQQLTYQTVDEILAGSAPAGQNTVHDDIRLLGSLSEQFRNQRKGRGAFFVQPPQFNVRVHPGGQIDVDRIDQNAPARAMVSEFMILCGHMTARYCSERAIPIVYRQQAPSTVDLTAISNQDLDHAQMMSIIRQMKPARVSKEPGIHSGLGLSAYCRVTSPIRRFSDFLIIAQIRHHIQTGSPLVQQGALMQMVRKNDQLIRRNNQIMRAANNYWVLKFYQQITQKTVRARVLDVDGQRIQLYLEQTGYITTVHRPTPPEPGETVEVKLLKAFPRQNKLVVQL